MPIHELIEKLDSLMYNDCVIVKARSGFYCTASQRLNSREWNCIVFFDDTCIVIIFPHRTKTDFAVNLLKKIDDLCDGYELL